MSRLEESGVPYMLTGSLASVFHGEPRATRDVDVVIDPDPGAFQALLESFASDWYVNRGAAEAALRERGMFNVVDALTGWKADLIMRKDRAYSVEEFSRRRRAELLGMSAWVVSAEDSILSKLEWAHAGRSSRQVEDAVAVVSANRGSLDTAYLRTWAGRLGVAEELERILRA